LEPHHFLPAKFASAEQVGPATSERRHVDFGQVAHEVKLSLSVRVAFSARPIILRHQQHSAARFAPCITGATTGNKRHVLFVPVIDWAVLDDIDAVKTHRFPFSPAVVAAHRAIRCHFASDDAENSSEVECERLEVLGRQRAQIQRGDISATYC
jgi:hypothetical protein